MDNRIATTYAGQLYSKITPTLRHDDKESRESWQSRAREKLSSLLGLNHMVTTEEDGFELLREFDTKDGHGLEFQFQSEPGYFVPCYLLVPKGREEEKLPVCICIQGHSTGMHNSVGLTQDGAPMNEEQAALLQSGDRDFAVRAVKEGYAAFCLEQRYMGRTGTFRDAPGCAKGAQCMATLLLGRTAIGERVWDTLRLIDLIEKRFSQYATKNLLCLGNSGGGTTAFYAACMDERIRQAMPSCSFCTFQNSIVDIRHCACNYIPGIAHYFDMGDLAGLIAPRDLIVVHGDQDEIFPDFAVRRAFRQAEELFKKFGGHAVLVTGEGGHRFYADAAWKAVHQIKE